MNERTINKLKMLEATHPRKAQSSKRLKVFYEKYARKPTVSIVGRMTRKFRQSRLKKVRTFKNILIFNK